MKTKKHLIIIILILPLAVSTFSFPLPATAEETTDYEIVPCENPDYYGWAWILDYDPAGTNVRSGPGTNYPVITRLPTDHAVIVKITGSVGEWIQIGDTSIFPVDGWIHGSLLVVLVHYSTPLYKEPSFDAPVLTMIPQFTYITIAGCQDGWTKVRYEKFEGWIPPKSHQLEEAWHLNREYIYENKMNVRGFR
ncbi:MAG: SH3 domain-containing protein [Deltaproteobacteria bacterium]|nr:SH3 domain-containing protein [Candidatus Zymogenaceae bacterium]